MEGLVPEFLSNVVLSTSKGEFMPRGRVGYLRHVGNNLSCAAAHKLVRLAKEYDLSRTLGGGVGIFFGLIPGVIFPPAISLRRAKRRKNRTLAPLFCTLQNTILSLLLLPHISSHI